MGHRDLLPLQTFWRTQNLPPKEWGGQEFTSCLLVTWGCSLGLQLSSISNLAPAETEHASAMACRLIGAVSWGKIKTQMRFSPTNWAQAEGISRNTCSICSTDEHVIRFWSITREDYLLRDACQGFFVLRRKQRKREIWEREFPLDAVIIWLGHWNCYVHITDMSSLRMKALLRTGEWGGQSNLHHRWNYWDTDIVWPEPPYCWVNCIKGNKQYSCLKH